MSEFIAEIDGMRLRDLVVRLLRSAGAPDADDLASETMLRLLRNVKSGAQIASPEAYVRQVARHVLQEARRERWREDRMLREFDPGSTGSSGAQELSDCLRYCKRACLARDELTLIEAYYGSEAGPKAGSRRKLATKMRLSENGLRLAAFRVRRKLYECMLRCRENGQNEK